VRRREDEAHVRALVGGDVHALDCLLVALDACGIRARDDDEILVALVALLAREPELVSILLERNVVDEVRVIVRALREKLVLDVHAGDARAYAFAHCAHRVQRLAPSGTGVHDDGDAGGVGHVARDADLLRHREHRLADAGGAAGYEPAAVYRFKPHRLGKPRRNRVVRGRQLQELTRLEQGA
jgi:hypothetical protein